MSDSERDGRFPLGVLVDRTLPSYLDAYRRTCEIAAKMRAEGKI
jgi:hypothetical protein